MKNMYKQVRIWILLSWSFLTIGILLGSWWAYHELGWGGWWFWDPVENASLMPWLLATAGIHSILKTKLNPWTSFCIQFTFLFSVLGTFFVRSGLLSSVHSFATDSTRGLFLLFFLFFLLFLSFMNWICQFSSANYRQMRKDKPDFSTKSEKSQKRKGNLVKGLIEQLVLMQNFYFCVFCAVVFCGTSAPIFFQWFWKREIITGSSFYNSTLIPLFTSVLFVLFYTHFIQFYFQKQVKSNPFKKFYLTSFGNKKNANNLFSRTLSVFRKKERINLQSYFFFYFFLHVIICMILFGFPFLNSIYAAICFLLVSCLILSQKTNRIFAFPVKGSLSSLPNRHLAVLHFNSVDSKLPLTKQTPQTKFSKKEMITAHMGLVLFLLGILFSNTLKFEYTEQLYPGSSGIRLGSQVCCLRSIDHSFAPTYHSICANLLIYQETNELNSFERIRLLHTSFLKEIFKVETNQSRNTFSRFAPQKEIEEPYSIVSMFPEKRFYYSSQNMVASKVSIYSNLFTDFYSIIGTGSMEAGWFTTLMKLPFIFCIWLGFTFGVIGGVMSLKKQLGKSKLRWL